MIPARNNKYLLLLSATLVFVLMICVILIMFQSSKGRLEYGIGLFLAGLLIHYSSLAVGAILLALRMTAGLNHRNFYYCLTGVSNLMIFAIYLMFTKVGHDQANSFFDFLANLLAGVIIVMDVLLD